MDNPGGSLFQAAEININNSQNNEEEEDLEDQIRRREELQNLLTAALDDFNYDDSTINSSTNLSVASSLGDFKQVYKDSQNPDDQLKILYEVRMREINNLRNEYQQFKVETEKDINNLKNKLILSEAECRQLTISLNNAESLLVEKEETITQLKENLVKKNEQLTNQEKSIENLQLEVSTYMSTINELHLKIQAESGPFNLNSKFNSEELQNAQHDKIFKLETMLEEEITKCSKLEKENEKLQDEIKSFVILKNDMENEHNAIVTSLNKTLDGAQKQCKELLTVVEMLSRENEHFKERINNTTGNELPSMDMSQSKSLDNVTLVGHTEKLRKMLLDKAIEIDTLKSKVRFYENDMAELVEYRQLQSDVYRKEFKQCDNVEHTKDLLVMQNDLQNYRRTIDDKNQQILNLNSINKELQEKIEDMIIQTRTEIKNLSDKYSLPKLESMSEELKISELKVKELTEKLEKSEQRRQSLTQKVHTYTNSKKEAELNEQLDSANKKVNELNKINNEMNKKCENHAKNQNIVETELHNIKEIVDSLKAECQEISEDCTNNSSNICNSENDSFPFKLECEYLKNNLSQIVNYLKNRKNINYDKYGLVKKIKTDMNEFLKNLGQNTLEFSILKKTVTDWKNRLDRLTQTNFIVPISAENSILKLEDEKTDLNVIQKESKDFCCQIDTISHIFKDFEDKIKNLESIVAQKQCIIINLQEKENKLEILESKWKNEISEKDSALRMKEEGLTELNKNFNRVKVELEELKKEKLILETELSDITNKFVRRSLEQELKQAEHEVEESRRNNLCENISQNELLNNELKLRDELQVEYEKKIKDIEHKYQKVYYETKELCKQQSEKLESQEAKYREYLKVVLSECTSRAQQSELEKQKLTEEIILLGREFNEYKKNMSGNEEKYNMLLKKIDLEAGRSVDAWKLWAKNFVSNCLEIEAKNKNSRNKITESISHANDEISAIEKKYNSMLKKLNRKQPW